MSGYIVEISNDGFFRKLRQRYRTIITGIWCYVDVAFNRSKLFPVTMEIYSFVQGTFSRDLRLFLSLDDELLQLVKLPPKRVDLGGSLLKPRSYSNAVRQQTIKVT